MFVMIAGELEDQHVDSCPGFDRKPNREGMGSEDKDRAQAEIHTRWLGNHLHEAPGKWGEGVCQTWPAGSLC